MSIPLDSQSISYEEPGGPRLLTGFNNHANLVAPTTWRDPLFLKSILLLLKSHPVPFKPSVVDF